MTELTERGKQVRRDTYALSKAHGGYHYGGCFSSVEIILALFDSVLMPEDGFILSKGHACWPLYVLLRERGLNPRLEGHPHRDEANGILATTGSLGHGLPVGIGISQARKQTGRPGKVYVLMGDGECQEGTTWESLILAAKLGLDNLTVIVDMNRLQGSDFTENVLPVSRLGHVASVLGWLVDEVDGHSIPDLERALARSVTTMPHLIIAHTIKGRGVSFMENRPEWHSKWPNQEQEAGILKELA